VFPRPIEPNARCQGNILKAPLSKLSLPAGFTLWNLVHGPYHKASTVLVVFRASSVRLKAVHKASCTITYRQP